MRLVCHAFFVDLFSDNKNGYIHRYAYTVHSGDSN